MSRHDAGLSNEIDLQLLVDDGPFGLRRALILVLVLLAMLADGLDITIISLLSPAIAHDLRVGPAELGGVFSAGLFGMIVGSGVMGALGDALGRRPAMLLSLAISAVTMFGAATSDDLLSLAAWRFLTGVGIGAVAPIGLVLAAEFAPRRVRATVTACMFIGLGVIGTAIAAWLATTLLPAHGWRPIFVVAGAFNLAIAILLAVGLPESLRYLYARRADLARLGRAVRRLDPSIEPRAARFVWSGELVSGPAPYHLLFEGARGQTTVLLWVAMFCAQMTTYALLLWLPVLLGSAGASPTTIGLTLTFYASFATLGGIAVSWVVDRYGPGALIALPLGGVPLLLLAATLGPSSPLLAPLAAVIGLPVGGALQGLLVISGTFYPTAIRSNGVGLAMLVSRFGSILGPAFLSIFIARNAPAGATLAVCALPLLATGATTLWLVTSGRGRASEAANRPGSV